MEREREPDASVKEWKREPHQASASTTTPALLPTPKLPSVETPRTLSLGRLQIQAQAPAGEVNPLERQEERAASPGMLGPFAPPSKALVHETEVHGQAFSFQGRTIASYAHSWNHENDKVDGDTRTGTLVETFNVTTTVRLPPVPGGLNDCERKIVSDAINIQLVAHEQQHVNAFHSNYDGTVRSPYSVTGSVADATTALAAIHASNESARRASADAASAALDPFQIDVDTSSCDSQP